MLCSFSVPISSATALSLQSWRKQLHSGPKLCSNSSGREAAKHLVLTWRLRFSHWLLKTGSRFKFLFLCFKRKQAIIISGTKTLFSCWLRDPDSAVKKLCSLYENKRVKSKVAQILILFQDSFKKWHALKKQWLCCGRDCKRDLISPNWATGFLFCQGGLEPNGVRFPQISWDDGRVDGV